MVNCSWSAQDVQKKFYLLAWDVYEVKSGTIQRITYRAVARREGVSDRQLGMMVGNAIATNVLRAILPRMLTKIGKQ